MMRKKDEMPLNNGVFVTNKVHFCTKKLEI